MMLLRTVTEQRVHARDKPYMIYTCSPHKVRKVSAASAARVAVRRAAEPCLTWNLGLRPANHQGHEGSEGNRGSTSGPL